MLSLQSGEGGCCHKHTPISPDAFPLLTVGTEKHGKTQKGAEEHIRTQWSTVKYREVQRSAEDGILALGMGSAVFRRTSKIRVEENALLHWDDERRTTNAGKWERGW